MSADPQIIAKVMPDYDAKERAKSNQAAGYVKVPMLAAFESHSYKCDRFLLEFGKVDPRLYCHLATAAHAASVALEVVKEIEREKHGANAGTA